MSDWEFPMPIPGLKGSKRISTQVAPIIDETVDIYAEDGLQWELMPCPIPTAEGNVQIGAVFAIWMPTPVLDGSKFMVSNQLGDIALFEKREIVRQIVHDYIEALRKMKADWLRGAN